MKKVIFLLFFAVAALNLPIVKADNSDKKAITASVAVNASEVSHAQNKLNNDEEVKRLTDRLYEIKNMDRSQMTRSEKRELRKEVLAIKDKLHKEHTTYVYISAGAIILIILLLLLL